MNGMTVSEFINKIFYGSEIEFKINKTFYLIQGKKDNQNFILTVDYWNKTDGTEPEHDYLFSASGKSYAECVQKFEDAAIFGGKTIYEAESEIEVTIG